MLRAGDSLALYTDGLLEAHAPERTLTREEMIERLRERSPEVAREDTIEALLGLVDLDEDVRDDIAILSARVTSAAGSVGSIQAADDGEAQEPVELDVAASAQRGAGSA